MPAFEKTAEFLRRHFGQFGRGAIDHNKRAVVALGEGAVDNRLILAPFDRGRDQRPGAEAAVAKDAKTQVVIAGDRAVSHGRVVWVLDVVKSLGVASFAIQIDPAGLVPPANP